MNYFISLVLDDRRAKKNGKYPVKLRVFTSQPRTQKLFSTPFEFTEADFDSTWHTQKTRNEFRDNKYRLQAFEKEAQEVAIKIQPFNMAEFERLFFKKVTGSQGVFALLENAIKQYINNGQISTASNYEQTLKTFKDFLKHEKGREVNKLYFHEITPEWLRNYENYMIQVRECNFTTVGINLRNLRALFNRAIADGEITAETYPFRKGVSENNKYVIPSSRNIKKALNKEQLKTLLEAKTENPRQQMARDFFFFSYCCNGMNVKDIAMLKYRDIKEKSFSFLRAKTIHSTRKNLTPIQVHLNEFCENVISKYGNENKESFVFPIYKDNMSELEKYNAKNNFIRFINDHLKTLAEKLGLPVEISFYWARHSFSTQVILRGGSMEYVMQALGHTDTKTTLNYFAGFEKENVKEISEQLMKF